MLMLPARLLLIPAALVALAACSDAPSTDSGPASATLTNDFGAYTLGSGEEAPGAASPGRSATRSRSTSPR